MSKKPKRGTAPRHTTQSRDIQRWLNRAAQQLATADYLGVIATAGRVLRAPIATREQRTEAYEHLGAAHMLSEHYDEAYAMVAAAIALTPDSPMLWYNLGIALRYTSRLAQSLRAFEHTQTLDAHGLLAEKLAGALTSARSMAEQERVLRGPNFTLDQLITQEKLFHQAMQEMAQAHWAAAEPLFRQSIAIGDVLPQPWGNLGICLMMQYQFDACEAAFQRALEIDPSYTIARQNLAGMPAIRASGKLPVIRVSNPFIGKSVKMNLTFLPEGNP